VSQNKAEHLLGFVTVGIGLHGVLQIATRPGV